MRYTYVFLALTHRFENVVCKTVAILLKPQCVKFDESYKGYE